MNRAVERSSLCGMDVRARSGGAVCFFTNGCDVIMANSRCPIDIKLFRLTGQSLPKKNGAQSPIGTDVTVGDVWLMRRDHKK